jgi:hypothetical protein
VEIMIEHFEKLEYNRKVDVLVAIYVMGWKDIVIHQIEWGPGVWKCAVMGVDRFNGRGYIPLYSTLLASAWDVVRKFDYIYLFRSKDYKDGQWECKLRDDRGVVTLDMPKYYAWAETEMLAICYAGLKAVGFDIKTFLREEGK